MRNVEGHFIAGHWRRGEGTDTRAVVNPATEEVAATIQLGTDRDVDLAVAAAREAFPAWSAKSLAERLVVMRALRTKLTEHADELASIITTEVGTPRSASRPSQVDGAEAFLKDTIALAEGYDLDAPEKIANSHVYREPLGVVAIISPWNVPLLLTMYRLAPALAAGCTVVLKPSEVTPLNAARLAELCAEAGVPPGVFNVVNGLGPVVGEALARHPRVDMVGFTGSTRSGRRVYEVASGTVKRLSLELGGKSANIVLDDADLTRAVTAGAQHVFALSGQRCFAWTRLLVPRAHLGAAEEIAHAAADALVAGDPRDPATTLGPLVSEVQRERVRGYIHSGIEQGAKLVTGGVEPPAGLSRGYYVRGTVFSRVSNDMRIAREEIFGPVVCLIPYDTEDDAIAIANDSEFGLHGAVFSADTARATRVARRLRTGRVDINGAAYNRSAPFGGYKQSGLGREFGAVGFHEYFELKAIQY